MNLIPPLHNHYSFSLRTKVSMSLSITDLQPFNFNVVSLNNTANVGLNS